MIKNHSIRPYGGYSDEESELLGSMYDVSSYKGTMTLPEDLRLYDPFFSASMIGGEEVIGLTLHLAYVWKPPVLDRLNSDHFKEEYQRGLEAGLLRFVDETVPTLEGGFETGVFFPTEKLVKEVLVKKSN